MKASDIFLTITMLLVFLGLLAAGFNIEKAGLNDNFLENQFSAFTSAVCKEGNNFTACKDQVFVNCSGRVFKADDITSCNDITVDMPQVSAFAVFEKGWKDPRI